MILNHVLDMMCMNLLLYKRRRGLSLEFCMKISPLGFRLGEQGEHASTTMAQISCLKPRRVFDEHPVTNGKRLNFFLISKLICPRRSKFESND